MKYSVDYAEGYLEGLGCDVVDSIIQKPRTVKAILKCVIDGLDYDFDTDKVLDCICTDEFLKIHPIS